MHLLQFSSMDANKAKTALCSVAVSLDLLYTVSVIALVGQSKPQGSSLVMAHCNLVGWPPCPLYCLLRTEPLPFRNQNKKIC